MPHNNSLFERLECEGSTRSCNVASVAAHLGKMLSTRVGSVQALPDYGLPDFNDMGLSLHESLSRSRLLTERFIRAYEPRLANVHVRISPRSGESLTLTFTIEAEMSIDGATQSVMFHARLDDAGRVEVGADGI